MKHLQHLLVYSLASWRIVTKDQLEHFYRHLIALIIAIIMPISASASITCKGHFVNPVTDICWSCIMPISIGRVINIGKGMSPAKRDRANPKSALCLCTKANILTPGLSIGFWEPARLVDITRTPYCMVNLGGIEFGNDKRKISSSERGYNRRNTHTSFYHVHYYIYPLIYWLELLTDFLCLEKGIA
jgi:conjugal transfer pilus assembly protein TraU